MRMKPSRIALKNEQKSAWIKLHKSKCLFTISFLLQIDQVSNSRSRISDKNATNCKTDSETADTASIVSSPGK